MFLVFIIKAVFFQIARFSGLYGNKNINKQLRFKLSHLKYDFLALINEIGTYRTIYTLNKTNINCILGTCLTQSGPRGEKGNLILNLCSLIVR